MAHFRGYGTGTTDVRLLEIDTGAIAIWDPTSDEELDKEATMAWRQVSKTSAVSQHSRLPQRYVYTEFVHTYGVVFLWEHSCCVVERS